MSAIEEKAMNKSTKLVDLVRRLPGYLAIRNMKCAGTEAVLGDNYIRMLRQALAV
jgi:hypothetical protein